MILVMIKNSKSTWSIDSSVFFLIIIIIITIIPLLMTGEVMVTKT